MSVKNAIDQTLQKPMSRKDFLGHVGAVFLAIIGITSVMHALGMHDSHAPQPSDRVSANGSGYGSSAYGA